MKYKTLYFGFGFSLLALLVSRFCQLAFAIETATGFYKLQYENFGVVSAALIIICILAITFFSFTDISCERKTDNSKLVGVFSCLAGVGFVIKAVFGYQPTIANFSLVISVLAVVSAVVLFLYAYWVFVGKTQEFKFFVLIAPFWILELVFAFLQNNDVSAVPERFYEIITAALCLVFSLYQAKDKAKMLTPISSKIMVATSLITSIFCIILSLPKIVLMASGSGNVLHDFAMTDVMYLCYGVFIAVYIFASFRPQKA